MKPIAPPNAPRYRLTRSKVYPAWIISIGDPHILDTKIIGYSFDAGMLKTPLQAMTGR